MKLIYSQDVINLIEKSPINGWVKDALINDIKELPDLGNCKNCEIVEWVTGDLKVKCLSCGHHIAERPFEVYCNIMCKWVNEKDYCTMFEFAHTIEEFMHGQDLGSPEDGSL